MTAKIRTLVVDDEPIARARVLSLLREESDIEVVGECSDGPQAMAAIEQMSPDLVFLDIQIPQLNGLELARTLSGSHMPAVVFVTAYDEYALGAFEIHALDYLLKPFSAERFQSALAHAREHLARRQSAAGNGRQLPAMLPDTRQPASGRERLVIKSSGRIYFVRTADIDWCEAAGNYIRIHVGQQAHLVRCTMAHLETQLEGGPFVRIHRSTIVNVDRIDELRSSFNGEYVVLLRGGTRLTLSRGYRDALQTRLGKSV
jgi:two-component system LytT family response regulator